MDRQNAHIFNVLSEKSAFRFEEVNTYSRQMTSWFCRACGMMKAAARKAAVMATSQAPP